MAFYLVKGEFLLWLRDDKGRVHRSQPDGDTIWFRPRSTRIPELLGASVSNGRTSLRLEGVDALEIHYQGSHHQHLRDSVRARDELLDWFGFGEVTWRASDHEPALTVDTAGVHPINGYIVTGGIDNGRNRRLVSWVFKGDADARDGTRIEPGPAHVRESLNGHLALTGLAYPMLYETAPEILRAEVVRLADDARGRGVGVWRHDVTTTGATVRNEGDLSELAMWPKLYRRLFAFLADGGTDLRDLQAWMRADRERNDAMMIQATGERVRFADLVETTKTRVKMVEGVGGVVVE